MLSIVLMVMASFVLRAQPVPMTATPQGIITIFLTETASSIDTIDRGLFKPRMAGELGNTDPRRFQGMIPVGTKVRIDSLPLLPYTDGFVRAVAFVTAETGLDEENYYIYCVGDSIWRMEAIRSFPSASQAAQLRQSLRDLDTTTPARRYLRDDLRRLLLDDDSLQGLLRRNLSDAELLVAPLARSKKWGAFALRDVDFVSLDEYHELDDDVPATDLVFYSLDRQALERLKQRVGIKRIERDKRYPGLLFLVGANLEQSSYGYLHATDPRALPTLSSDEFIMLKPAAPGWWLYKRIRR